MFILTNGASEAKPKIRALVGNSFAENAVCLLAGFLRKKHDEKKKSLSPFIWHGRFAFGWLWRWR